MNTKLEAMTMTSTKTDVPAVRPGDVVRVHQKVKEGDKERIQVFEGVVLAKKHGKGMSATIMVRKVTQGVGVERIFPLHSPLIYKIEVVRRSKTRRAKLYFLRYAKGRKARLRAKEFNLEVPEQQPVAQEELMPEEAPQKQAEKPKEETGA